MKKWKLRKTPQEAVMTSILTRLFMIVLVASILWPFAGLAAGVIAIYLAVRLTSQ